MTDDLVRERLLAKLPVTEGRRRLGGVSSAVVEGGDGPPLILLHGGIECGGAYWAPVIPALAERFRLVVPDVPGLGASEPLVRLDAKAFGDWFAELVLGTCRERPVVVAHSLLGSLAARFAIAHGDVLRALVIYGTPGIGPYHMPLGLRVVALRFGLRPSERNEERFQQWAFHDLERIRRRDPEWLEAFGRYTRARAAVPHVKRTMRQLVARCTKRVPDAELRRIAPPTTLLWGRQDRFVPLALAEAASRRLAWPLHVIDEAGHVPHVERPEAFLRALDAALLTIPLDTTAGRRQA